MILLQNQHSQFLHGIYKNCFIQFNQRYPNYCHNNQFLNNSMLTKVSRHQEAQNNKQNDNLNIKKKASPKQQTAEKKNIIKQKSDIYPLKQINFQNNHEQSMQENILYDNKKNIIRFNVGKEFQLTDILGSGEFSEVYKIISLQNNIEFALKVVQKNRKDYSKEENTHLNKLVEKQISVNLQLISKRFLCNYTFHYENPNFYFICHEYIDGIPLRHFVSNNDFSDQQIQYIGASLLLAIDQCHKMRIIHRDIKPDNVVISLQGQLKLIDFGYAKQDENFKKNSSLCGTCQYCSLQMFDGDYSFEVDLWGFIIIMYQLITGSHPFLSEGDIMNKSDYQKMIHLRRKIKKKEVLHHNSENKFYQFIQQYLKSNIQERRQLYTIEYIKNLEIFKNICWASLSEGLYRSPLTIDKNCRQEYRNKHLLESYFQF